MARLDSSNFLRGDLGDSGRHAVEDAVIELHLPFPPSNNALWRSNRGRVHKSEEYNAWLRDAGWMIVEQYKGQAISGPYELTIQAKRPDKRHRDLGNLEKPISDLLKQMRVIEDDRFAEDIHLQWVTEGSPITVWVQPASLAYPEFAEGMG